MLRQPTERTPCWLMRQAGRYLPEYRALRAQAGSFTELLRQPELAAELAMQPLRRYDLDAAIVFSDILTIPDAMGMELYFTEGKGPRFAKPLHGPADIDALRAPDPNKDLSYVLQTVQLTRRRLDNTVPLIGFCGSPWTLFVYMVAKQEGCSSQERAASALKFAARYPLPTQQVLSLLATAVGDLLLAQQAAGAQALMVFDSWGGATKQQFDHLSLPFLQQICQRLKGTNAPVILYVPGGENWLPQLQQTGCDCIGLNQHASLRAARLAVGGTVAVQGNLNPELLSQSEAQVREGVRKVLGDAGKEPGHIFNLGHGIRPEADPELVQCMVETVHSESSARR